MVYEWPDPGDRAVWGGWVRTVAERDLVGMDNAGEGPTYPEGIGDVGGERASEVGQGGSLGA
jgi:hypothetical protein